MSPLDLTKADALEAQAVFNYIAELKVSTAKKRKEPSDLDAEMSGVQYESPEE